MPNPLQHKEVHRLDAENATRLDRDGYLLLRSAIPADWIAPLRAAFEGGELASDKWPVSRGHDWRHALVDLDATVQQVCYLPLLLAATHHILQGAFLLTQVEGREPRPKGGAQLLHRDGAECRNIETVSVLVFLDPFGPENGATCVVPGSHKGVGLAAPSGVAHPDAAVLRGNAGDVLLFGSTLLHCATRNESGAPRRSLLLCYAIEALRNTFDQTRALRGVRMNTDIVFDCGD
jgi:ectoine hydroxylase-related dioxygenase (phytanoyl-CoA dioxygenase family)